MGRHRKPSSSSISVAKVAVTGAVIGTGSLGLAGQAVAATDAEWDTVASCESSGNWSINTGNGYHGGLQFAPSTWLGYGGGQYASAAHLATKDQQIAIAEKVLAGQGKGAWPVCGRGLSGPTPRTLSVSSTPKPAAPVVDPAAPPAAPEAPAPAAADAPAPQDAPIPADAIPPAPEAPAPAPAPEAPAPAAADAPAPAAPAPADVPAPADAPLIETDTTVTAEEVEESVIEVGAALPAGNDGAVMAASHSTPAPLTPADPAVPPVLPVTDGAAPVAPAAPADPAATAVTPAATTTTTGATTTTVAAGQTGTPHLPSPDSPPPGTTNEPVDTTNPNVSYLKELWHAVQNQEIDRGDLLLALSQRSLTSPVPTDARTNSAPVPAAAPAPAAPPAPADQPPAPADQAPAPAPADPAPAPADPLLIPAPAG